MQYCSCGFACEHCYESSQRESRKVSMGGVKFVIGKDPVDGHTIAIPDDRDWLYKAIERTQRS
jgi:hypothetical protein